jgi:uncharacterized protein (TIGR01244 family)
MNKLTLSLVITLAMLLTACMPMHRLDSQRVIETNTTGLKQVNERVFASGQPSKEQLITIRDAGIKNIIGLRPDSELDWDEDAFVSALGMTYHSIPVSGVDGITDANSKLLQQTLALIGDEPLLVHCSSGNRVGALIAMNEYKHNKQSLDASINEGKRWGLTKLESTVRAILVDTKVSE